MSAAGPPNGADDAAAEHAAHAHGPLGAVERHIAAFNDADIDAVMTGFDDEAVFATADQLVVGARAIRRLFADSFGMPVTARLELQRAVVSGDTVACELSERIEGEGLAHEIDVAAFYTVRQGRLARVRIYRDLAGG